MLVTPEDNRENKLWACFSSAVAFLVPFLLCGSVGAFKRGGWIYIFIPTAILAVLVFIQVRKKVRRRFEISGRPLSPTLDRALAKDVAFYRGLNPKDREHFQRLIRLFLEEVPVIGVETPIDDQVRILVAASAVIPVFGFPNWRYRLSSVLVYPGPLSASITGMEGGERILGQAQTDSGRVLLSKPDLIAGFQNPVDRRNVGMHEFAHMIDAADGSVDGTPPVPPEEWEGWQQLMEEVLQDPEQAHVLMDPYGFTNKAEFFACLTESFFETPVRLKEKNPVLFDYLKKFYGQNPVPTLKAARKGKARPGKIGRNSRCPCGSRKKYKRCCLNRKEEPLSSILE